MKGQGPPSAEDLWAIVDTDASLEIELDATDEDVYVLRMSRQVHDAVLCAIAAQQGTSSIEVGRQEPPDGRDASKPTTLSNVRTVLQQAADSTGLFTKVMLHQDDARQLLKALDALDGAQQQPDTLRYALMAIRDIYELPAKEWDAKYPQWAEVGVLTLEYQIASEALDSVAQQQPAWHALKCATCGEELEAHTLNGWSEVSGGHWFTVEPHQAPVAQQQQPSDIGDDPEAMQAIAVLKARGVRPEHIDALWAESQPQQRVPMVDTTSHGEGAKS